MKSLIRHSLILFLENVKENRWIRIFSFKFTIFKVDNLFQQIHIFWTRHYWFHNFLNSLNQTLLYCCNIILLLLLLRIQCLWLLISIFSILIIFFGRINCLTLLRDYIRWNYNNLFFWLRFISTCYNINVAFSSICLLFRLWNIFCNFIINFLLLLLSVYINSYYFFFSLFILIMLDFLLQFLLISFICLILLYLCSSIDIIIIIHKSLCLWLNKQTWSRYLRVHIIIVAIGVLKKLNPFWLFVLGSFLITS